MGQIQGGGGKVHEALIHSRLMHTRTNMRRIRSALISVASKKEKTEENFSWHISFMSVVSAGYALIAVGCLKCSIEPEMRLALHL